MSTAKTLVEKLFNVTKSVEKYEKDTTVSMRSGGSYKGVSHDKVLRVVREHLIEERVLVTASVTAHEFHDNSNMAVASVRVTFINADDAKDTLSVDMFGFGLDTQDKGPGKAISYAVKYAFLKTFMMQTGDDPENDSIERMDLIKKKKEIKETAQSSSHVIEKPLLETQQRVLKTQVSKIGSWGEFVRLASAMSLGEVNTPNNSEDYALLIDIASKILAAQEASNEDT